MLNRSLLTMLLTLGVMPAMAVDRPDPLQATLDDIARQARPAQFGIVVELDDGRSARVNDGRSYMMMSSFKAPVAAAVLDRIDSGMLTLDHEVHLVPADAIAGSAVPSLGNRVAKGAVDVTVAYLLKASVSESDNTAVDALLKLIGGGPTVSDFLRKKGVHGMRVDIDERTMARVFEDLDQGQDEPVGETPTAQHDRLLRGYRRALALKENTTTLDGAADFLRKLQDGRLLSASSTKYLKHLMEMQVVPTRIRAGVPQGYVTADKTGTGGGVDGRMAAWNDMAIITSPSGRTAVVGAFLRDTAATPEQRDAWFKRIGAAVSTQLK